MTTMLIVEDDPAWRSLYALEFGPRFEVMEASDGLQALRMLDKVRPDVILLDLRLPRMDGPSFLRQLEARGVHAPVVVCSGALPESAAAMGCLKTAPKTADLRYVRSAVEAAVEAASLGSRAVDVDERPNEPEWLD